MRDELVCNVVFLEYKLDFQSFPLPPPHPFKCFFKSANKICYFACSRLPAIPESDHSRSRGKKKVPWFLYEPTHGSKAKWRCLPHFRSQLIQVSGSVEVLDRVHTACGGLFPVWKFLASVDTKDAYLHVPIFPPPALSAVCGELPCSISGFTGLAFLQPPECSLRSWLRVWASCGPKVFL